MIYICLRLLDTCAAFGSFELAQSVIKRFQSAIPPAMRHREYVVALQGCIGEAEFAFAQHMQIRTSQG